MLRHLKILCGRSSGLAGPITTLLVGMGLFVQGTTDLPSAQPVGSASLAVAAGADDWTIRGGGSGFRPLADALGQKRGPRSRLLEGSGRAPPGPDVSLPSGHPSPVTFWRSRAPRAPTVTAASVYVRNALARSGRLSAPSTAPPTSLF